MQKYIQEIFPRLLRFSKSLDNQTILVDQNWLVSNENSKERKIFIFRNNNELIVSTNGVVEKGNWDYIANAKSVLIEFGDKKILYNQAFIDNKILLLKQDGCDELMIFGNENKLKDLNNIKYYIQREYQPKLIGIAKPISIPSPPPEVKPKTQEEILSEEIEYLTETISNTKLVIMILLIVTIILIVAIFWNSDDLEIQSLFGFLSLVFIVPAMFLWIGLRKKKWELFTNKDQLRRLKK